MVRTLRIISRIIGIGGGVLAALFFATSIFLGMSTAGPEAGVGTGPGGFAAGGGAVALGLLGICLIPAIGLQVWADRIEERQMAAKRAAYDRAVEQGRTD